jgi:hypothetical protein
VDVVLGQSILSLKLVSHTNRIFFLCRGYQLWNAPLDCQVSCYRSLSTYLVPPAVPVTSQMPVPSAAASTQLKLSTLTQNPTSAIVNVVYAIQYPVQPASSGLTTGAEAGIGAGAGVAGIVIIVLPIMLLMRTQKHKKGQASAYRYSNYSTRYDGSESKHYVVHVALWLFRS